MPPRLAEINRLRSAPKDRGNDNQNHREPTSSIARDLGYIGRCGLDEEAIGVYGARRAQRSPLPFPASLRFIACGETVKIGDRMWTATIADGHACGSLIPVDKDGELALVGDEILPNTTPHVGTAGTATPVGT